MAELLLASAGVTKIDPTERNVFGWAYVSKTADGEQVVDHSGEMVDTAELEAAAYEFVVASREGGDLHKGDAVATMIESVVFTEEKAAALGIPAGTMPVGWWVGFHVPDPEVFAKVASGERAMFSIAGTALHEPHVEKAVPGSVEDHRERLREALAGMESGGYVSIEATFTDRVVYEVYAEDGSESCYERSYLAAGDSFTFGPPTPVEVVDTVIPAGGA